MNDTQHSALSTQHCSYCGLAFSGHGYVSGEERFCCHGCYLVRHILGAKGEEGVAAGLLVRLGIGAFLSMNVMMISLLLYTTRLDPSTIRGFHWALVILSTPAVIVLGIPFITGALRELRRGRLSTDALIVTGSLFAYGVSATHVIGDAGHIYFDTATMLLLIVTLGRLLEASAKSRTSQAIREMMELAPEMALVVRDGKEIEIPVKEVRKGDRMIVRPGGRIPADGVLLSGECLVEESAFTGESRPRACAQGARVFGGSVNCDGLITVEATAVGADSLLNQIQQMVRHARDQRAPIERVMDRISAVFVPVVWMTALGAGAYWGVLRQDPEQAALSALAVLVVACPCALGLATPMATCLALGRAARGGVLIGSGEILERLHGVRRIFFDKTGTLTANRLTVAEIRMKSDEFSAEEVLAWAASLEAGCNHSIAAAIVTEAKRRKISLGTVEELKIIPGRGVMGTVRLNGESRQVVVGSSKLLPVTGEVWEYGGMGVWEKYHSIPSSAKDQMITIYVGWGGKIRAAITLLDRPRPDALQTIHVLKAMGIESVILSGDMEGPTRRLAGEVGIDEVRFEQNPEDKLVAIREDGRKFGAAIAMVGDGINDAPALAAAHVGIAVATGTDLARQTGDVILLGDDLLRIPWAIELSRATYRIIHRNLIWAFGYNAIAILLAFFGFVHPLIAATAMVISSLCVVGNSMRTRGTVEG